MVSDSLTPPQHQGVGLAFVVNQIRSTGPIFVIRDIVAALPEGYYQPYVIELCAPEVGGVTVSNELRSMGCKILSLDFTRGQLELFPKSAARLLAECLDEHDIKLVHSHTYHPDLVTSYLTRQYIVLTTQHNIAQEDFTYSKGRLLGGYMYRRLLRSLRRHCYLIGVSQVCSQYYRRLLPHSVNIYTAPNGISPSLYHPIVSVEERYALRDSLSLPRDCYMITMTGSLSRRKNPQIVLRALRLLKRRGALPKDLLLVVLGTGPQLERCRRLARRLSDQVRFVGFTQQVDSYLRASNAAITSSLSEGFGLNVVESIASGCVTITTKIPPFNELLSTLPQLRELQFPPYQVGACADCILKARLTMLTSQEALDYGALYSNEQMALRYHRIYQQLIRKHL